MISFTKQYTFRSKPWLRAAASIPCVQCGKEGTQAAHRNEGKGMGLKVDDCLVAALCPECHAEIDQGNVLTRAERRQKLDIAILKTLVQLCREGKVVAK